MKTHTIKQLLSFYKPYKGLFAADLLCSLTAAAIGLVMPLGAGYITETVLTGDLGSAPGKILRVGADFRLECLGCGHQVMMARPLVEKSARGLRKPEKTPEKS